LFGGNQVLHAGNYSSYALPLSGGTVTGNIVSNGGFSAAGVYNQAYFQAIDANNFWITPGNVPWGLYFETTGGGLLGGSGDSNRLGFVGASNARFWVDLNNGNGWFGGSLSVGGNTALHAGNYTSYSPSLTGSGASGTWGINITGSASSASSASTATLATNATRIQYDDGPRDLSNRLPNTYTRTVVFDFVGAGTGNGSGNYAGVMTYSPWTGTSASTGDSSYQLAFANTTGVNASGQPKLSIRNGIDSTWNAWYTLLHSGNVGSYALPISGGTVTGQVTFRDSGDTQITLNGNGTTWSGITATDVNGTDYMWVYGATGTWAFGGGGSTVSGKKMHIHGGVTIGSSYAQTSNPTNGLSIEGQINISGSKFYTVSNASGQSFEEYVNAGSGASNWRHIYGGTGTGYGVGVGGYGIYYGSNADYNAIFLPNGTVSFPYNATIAGSQVLTAGNYSSYALPLSGGTLSGDLALGNNGANTGVAIFHGAGSGDYGRIRFYQAGNNNQTIHAFPTSWQSTSFTGGSAGAINISGVNGTTFGAWNDIDASISTSGVLRVKTSAFVAGNAVLHAGNYTSYSPSLGGSGASGTWSISVTGSSGSVSGLTLTNSSSGINPDSVTQNQIGYNTSISLFGQTDGGLYSSSYSSAWIHQIYGDFRSGQIAIRGKNSGTWQSWRTVLDSGNYSSYALPLSGGTVSGKIYATGNVNSYYYDVYAGDAYGLRFWSSDSYKISMGVSSLYQYGTVTDYSIKMQMDNGSPGRGFTWGRESYAPVAALNSTTGSFQTVGAVKNGNNLAIPNASWGAGGDQTGMVIFKFPGSSGNYGMVHMVFDIYEYSGNAVSTVIIGGHNWAGSWYNTGASVIGQLGKQVRLGYKDGQYCVVFGDSGSVWSYGQIVLRKIQNGGYYDNNMDLGAVFSVVFTSTESFSTIGGDLRQLRTPASFSAGGAITQSGNQVLHAANYSSYALPIGGGSMSGSINMQNCSVNYGYQFMLNNGFTISQGASSYAQFSNWVYLPNAHGFYSGVNGAHIYPNDQSSYGSWHIAGARNGWNGFSFAANNGSIQLMISPGSNETGFHNNAYGWQFRWNDGTAYVHKNSYGGGTSAAVLDSSNYSNYAVPTRGRTNWGDGTVINNVVGQLAWKNYSNNHTIFDASNSTTPSGTSCNNVNPVVTWTGSYPTLMGWNGSETYGVRVDSSRVSDRSSRAAGNFYIDDNYGCGIIGAYASTRYQGVFAMGASYKLPDDGTTTGTLYGIAWSHPNAGGAAGNLDSHGMLVLINGGYGSSMSYSIKASSNVTAYSDERLKTNWRPMPDNYVSRLAKVRVGIYDRIDGEKITQVGVGAQSLQKLLPQAIETANDEMQTLSVNYGSAALASAVELAKYVVEQDARIARLEALVETLLKDRP
jgi:hypothetical protein